MLRFVLSTDGMLSLTRLSLPFTRHFAGGSPFFDAEVGRQSESVKLVVNHLITGSMAAST